MPKQSQPRFESHLASTLGHLKLFENARIARFQLSGLATVNFDRIGRGMFVGEEIFERNYPATYLISTELASVSHPAQAWLKPDASALK
jgi:hypothetical protein